MLEGWRRRSEREWEERAWLAAHLLRAAGAKIHDRPVTADDLLGREPSEPEPLSEVDEREALAREYQLFLLQWKAAGGDPKDILAPQPGERGH